MPSRLRGSDKGGVGVLVKDIYIRDLTAVTDDMTVREAIDILYTHRLPGVPMVDENFRVVGFVSGSSISDVIIPDYVKRLVSTAYFPDIGLLAKELESIMDKPVSEVKRWTPVVEEEDTDLTALKLMLEHHRNVLPVVDSENRLRGVITKEAILSAIVRMLEEKKQEEGGR